MIHGKKINRFIQLSPVSGQIITNFDKSHESGYKDVGQNQSDDTKKVSLKLVIETVFGFLVTNCQNPWAKKKSPREKKI